MALRKTGPGCVPDELAVQVRGYRQTQSALQKNLPGGGLQQVSPTDHFGDSLPRIVHHAG